jgi:1,4-alpha-glucan branching enzyme
MVKADYRLNGLYKAEPALFEKQFSPEGLNGLIIQTIKMQLFRLFEKEQVKDDVFVVCILPR